MPGSSPGISLQDQWSNSAGFFGLRAGAVVSEGAGKADCNWLSLGAGTVGATLGACAAWVACGAGAGA